MRTLPNRQLSRYFDRYNVLEGTAMPMQARQLNWINVKDYLDKEPRYIELCQQLDLVIMDMQSWLKHEKDITETITLAISSGYRCLEWERIRKRTGQSQHCIGAAVDVYPVSSFLSQNNLISVVSHLYNKYQKVWPGGFAVKQPSYDSSGKLKNIGFLHFDSRPVKVRWQY
ncbi:MAG: hypothetical protein H0S84_07100 [Bacteroidales bacterium]|nr:hypothetical protein [Bacteroidales bacterium]